MELQTGKLRLSIEGYFLEDAGAMRDFFLGSHTQTGSFLAADEHRKEEKQLIKLRCFPALLLLSQRAIHSSGYVKWLPEAKSNMQLWTRDVDR